MKKIVSIVLALTIMCSITLVSAYATENTEAEKLEKELIYLQFKASEIFQNVGKRMPYTELTFVRLQNGIDYADEVLSLGSEATVEQYQDAIDVLEYAFNNPTVVDFFAEEAYVLSLKEHNENGFYYEDDWNDFSAKRDALRDSFKTKDEETISDAFFALHESFVNMTSKYTLLGDVNNDGKVNVDDATLVQKYLAGIENLTEMQKDLAYAYGSDFRNWYDNPKLTIDCVTGLQKCAAGLIDMYTSPNQYGMNVSDDFFTYNTNITLIIMGDPREDEVYEKIEELEAEGII